MEMLGEIDEETVEFRPTFDGERAGARLPARPGCPTCWSTAPPASPWAWPPTWPPTTCAEVLRGHQAGDDQAAPEAHRRPSSWPSCPDPTSPRAASIVDDGLAEAYATGRGSIRIRATAEIVDLTRAPRQGIVVTELPYLVGPERVVARIQELDAQRQARRWSPTSRTPPTATPACASRSSCAPGANARGRAHRAVPADAARGVLRHQQRGAGRRRPHHRRPVRAVPALHRAPPRRGRAAAPQYRLDKAQRAAAPASRACSSRSTPSTWWCPSSARRRTRPRPATRLMAELALSPTSRPSTSSTCSCAGSPRWPSWSWRPRPRSCAAASPSSRRSSPRTSASAPSCSRSWTSWSTNYGTDRRCRIVSPDQLDDVTLEEVEARGGGHPGRGTVRGRPVRLRHGRPGAGRRSQGRPPSAVTTCWCSGWPTTSSRSSAALTNRGRVFPFTVDAVARGDRPEPGRGGVGAGAAGQGRSGRDPGGRHTDPGGEEPAAVAAGHAPRAS